MCQKTNIIRMLCINPRFKFNIELISKRYVMENVFNKHRRKVYNPFMGLPVVFSINCILSLVKDDIVKEINNFLTTRPILNWAFQDLIVCLRK